MTQMDVDENVMRAMETKLDNQVGAKKRSRRLKTSESL